MVASGYFFVEPEVFSKIVGHLLCLSSSLEVLQSNADARHPSRSVEGNAADVQLYEAKKARGNGSPRAFKNHYTSM